MLSFLAIVLLGLFFGWRLSFFFSFIDNLLKRMAFSILIGSVSIMWLSLLSSWLAFRQLGAASTLFTIAVLLSATMLLRPRSPKQKAGSSFSAAEAVIIALIVGVYSLLNIFGVLFVNEMSGWSSIINVWGDYPLHIGIINSFALRDNFPPQYPVLINTPLTYSFGTDFLTAVLAKNGLGLREAIWLVNISLFFCLAVFIFYLAEKFSSSKKAAALTLLLFFFGSNAGIVNALGDALKGNDASLLLSRNYSHDEPHGLYFMNSIEAVFIPQRSALMGFAASALIYLILFRNFSGPLKKQNRLELLLAGFLFGLLPLMHAHSFLAAGAVSAILFLYRPSRIWLYFIIPAAFLAFPQLLWLGQRAGSHLFSFHPGWISSNEGKPLLDMLYFWLANGWIVLALSFAGLAFASRRQKVFYAPFLVLFLAGNLVRFQPWDFDNYKIFLHWHLLASVLASMVIIRLFDSDMKIKSRGRFAEKLPSSLRAYGSKALAIILIFLGTGTGLLTVLWLGFGKDSQFELYSAADLEIAEWIRTNTPPESVFLTSDAHNHLAHSIAGRQIVMGFAGWLWSHGLDYQQVESDVREIYRTGSCGLISKYGISYIFAGPQEIKFDPNISLFESRFEKVFSASDAGQNYYIFRTVC
ncbi:MAG: hypothetical protein HYX24_00570 [Candidatus Aenigmarchaeota archaeon]|nr:hypothetical protein [Candidatus Aenigmarchaeota archaeon]